MEYIPGYNLRQARQYFKTLDSKIALPQVIRLFQEICLIVDHMHQQRVLHPGTKPENVMIKQGQATEEAAWRPILINLGLLRPNKETVMSRDPITVRRLTYTVSPELLLGHATDIRSDVYALGVLLYDLAVGEPPFRPSNLTEAVRFHVETPVPTPRSINPVISEELEAIILKALAKNPADRYLSAKGMAQALAACLDAASLPAPAPKSEVSVLVEAQSLAVNPGESVSTTITLDNKGTLDDRCQIKITGIPEEWVALSPSVTTLQPGSQQEVQLTIQPPLSPQSRAGRHSVAVQVISEHGSKQIDQIRKVLIIAPYSQATRTLWPQEISTGQVSQVTIENHGNTTETFTIRPKPDGALKFQPEENRLKINPGESGQVDFRVTSRRQLLIAQRMTQTFSLDVISVDGRVDTLSGQVVSQGILKPSLVFGIVTVFLLFLCGVLILFFSVRSLPGAPTATLDARQTFDARTAIAIAVATEVGTATADWLSQDSDGDGLSNSEELALRTSPTNLDTDGDNLPDGAEVEILGTDPTLKDSDFDGIPDDEEVRNIWNPEDRDTDKDGTPDAFDEFPGLAPTATPRAQATPIASGTPMLHSVGFSDPQPFLNQANLFGIFTFGSPNSYVIAENAGSAVIEVEITPPASRQIQVNYSVEGSSASAGQDFSLTGSTIVFQSGDNHQTFQVNITDDTTAEGSETIFLVLRDPSPGVVISNPRIELVIADND
jgi:serine/threonine protein kinase